MKTQQQFLISLGALAAWMTREFGDDMTVLLSRIALEPSPEDVQTAARRCAELIHAVQVFTCRVEKELGA